MYALECEKELSNMGKTNENHDLVSKKMISMIICGWFFVGSDAFFGHDSVMWLKDMQLRFHMQCDQYDRRFHAYTLAKMQ